MGELAGEQCDDFGWAPIGAVDRSLVAEVTQHARFGAGRAWSATSTYALSRAPQRVYVVYTVEGGFDFTVDGAVVTTEPGDLVLLDGDAPTTAQTTAGTARFVWHFTPTLLGREGSRFRFHEPLRASNTSMRALMSSTNSVLNTAPPRTPAAQAHLGIAMEHLLAGALNESGTLPEKNVALHRDGVFTTAQLVIEARFRDPGFGVAELRKEISLSAARLHAIFQAFGTTPRREIERRRVSEVERLSSQILTFAEVIDRSGFTSTRQYRQAVDRSMPDRVSGRTRAGLSDRSQRRQSPHSTPDLASNACQS